MSEGGKKFRTVYACELMFMQPFHESFPHFTAVQVSDGFTVNGLFI